MKTEDVLRLIVIDDSSNDAETVSNMLRNAGHAVRAIRVEDDEDLREAISGQAWDMILAKPEIPYLSAADALGIVSALGSDIPLLVIADGASEEKVDEILKAGARDVVFKNQPLRLTHALLREVGGVAGRRQHRQCVAQLEEANQRAQVLVDSSRDAIAYVHDGMHIYANESYLKMFGYSDQAEIEGMPVMNMVSGADHGKFKDFLRNYMKGKAKVDELEVNGLRVDGKEIKMIMEFSPAAYEGEPCIQIIIRDQSISKELEKKLDSLSKKDLITGAYNRQYFLEQLERCVGKPGRSGAIFYVEPDNFKAIRDDAGIAAADIVLTEIAKILQKETKGTGGLVARFESNNFTMILPDLEASQAEEIAGRIVHAVGEHIYDVGGSTVTTSCSIGATLYNDAIQDFHEVVSRAEKAHAEAAQRGGGTFNLYNPAVEDMAEAERLSVWGQRIKQALRDNSFQLLYQPIVSLQGDPRENYEVLMRMLGEEGETVMPADFVPAAEKAGLMTAVDRWVIAHSVKVLTEQHRAGKPFNFFVKISRASIKDPRFLPWLRDLLKAARLQPETLVIEVSESVASSNLKALKVLTNGLRQLRIRITLDHFGLAPNYANLLKHCDSDFLKISGSIIRELGRSQEAKDKLKEITIHAKDEGKQTIAESVEDANTLAVIWSSSVDYIQGHFLQAPMETPTYDFRSMG